jgi:alkaline phosphatase D
MLGDAQERWFAKGLAAAPERWNFIAQQTLMARAGVRVGGRRRFSSDKWDGYPAARDRLLAAIVDNGLRSCVVLSGDEHAAYVADLKRDFDDERSPAIATEFCGTSITTSGRMQSATDRIVRENPHIVYGESARRGYVVFDVTAARCSARLRMIEDVTDRHTGVTTAATFAIDAGHPGVQRPTV